MGKDKKGEKESTKEMRAKKDVKKKGEPPGKMSRVKRRGGRRVY